MKTFEAYQTADGKLHLDEDKADKHEQDLLGAELDGLLALFNLDITRTQPFNALLGVMKKPEELRASIVEILRIMDFKGSDEDD